LDEKEGFFSVLVTNILADCDIDSWWFGVGNDCNSWQHIWCVL